MYKRNAEYKQSNSCRNGKRKSRSCGQIYMSGTENNDNRGDINKGDRPPINNGMGSICKT